MENIDSQYHVVRLSQDAMENEWLETESDFFLEEPRYRLVGLQSKRHIVD